MTADSSSSGTPINGIAKAFDQPWFIARIRKLRLQFLRPRAIFSCRFPLFLFEGRYFLHGPHAFFLLLHLLLYLIYLCLAFFFLQFPLRAGFTNDDAPHPFQSTIFGSTAVPGPWKVWDWPAHSHDCNVAFERYGPPYPDFDHDHKKYQLFFGHLMNYSKALLL